MVQQGVLGSKAQKVPGTRGLLIPTIRILVNQLRAETSLGKCSQAVGWVFAEERHHPDAEGLSSGGTAQSSAALALAWLHRTLLCSFCWGDFQDVCTYTFLY